MYVEKANKKADFRQKENINVNYFNSTNIKNHESLKIQNENCKMLINSERINPHSKSKNHFLNTVCELKKEESNASKNSFNLIAIPTANSNKLLHSKEKDSLKKFGLGNSYNKITNFEKQQNFSFLFTPIKTYFSNCSLKYYENNSFLREAGLTTFKLSNDWLLNKNTFNTDTDDLLMEDLFFLNSQKSFDFNKNFLDFFNTTSIKNFNEGKHNNFYFTLI